MKPLVDNVSMSLDTVQPDHCTAAIAKARVTGR
jgi:hypothetical protein